MLSEPERRRVEEAVRAAEAGTTGEIVVALARQAGGYKSVPLVCGLLAALLTPPLLLALTDWPATRIFAVQLAAAALAILIASPMIARFALTPRALKRARGREAAAREFASRGMADTRGRTGVLIYVAAAERYAEVVGDVTIAALVDEAEWRSVVADLVQTLSAGRQADGIIAAVGRVGAILARHVPPGSDDADELPNRVVML